MEDSNKINKILYDKNTIGLKKLVCANVAKEKIGCMPMCEGC
jgi:hypothetical protein